MKKKFLILTGVLGLVLAVSVLATVVFATPVGEAILEFPYDGQQVSGIVQIKCNAAVTSPAFAFYKVEFSIGAQPSGWGAVGGVKNEPPKDGICDTWDTTKQPNGPAWLRLTVVDNTSNYIQDLIQVVINNPAVTVGTNVCKGCHDETFKAWQATKHGANNIGCETCHGPGGTHVATGGNKLYIDKVFAAGLCGSCHKDIFADWSKSLHNNHPDVAEFGRSPCMNCHSAQGYVNVVFKGNDKFPVPYHLEGQTCATCHNPHSAANQTQLRFVGTSKLPSGQVVSVGLAANCANCHNQRRIPSDIEGQVKNAFGRGPHEGTSTEMLEATDAWEFPGKGYNFPSSPHKDVVTDTCVTCHMKPTANAAPIHAMEPQLAACKTCHGDVKSFEFQAKADYDGNGKAETIQHEVEGLMELVAAQLPKDPATWTNNKALNTEGKRGAAYNYLFVERDRSEGVHNLLYAVSLLQASYKEVTDKDVPNATLVIYQKPAPASASTQPAPSESTQPPAAQPTQAPAAASGPPNIPANHPTAGCTACHSTGVGGAPKFPANHASFTETQCATCHKRTL